MEYAELARAETERGEVVLRERRKDDAAPGVLELRVNGVFVMDTHETSSEEALATAALAQVERPAAVLVGGLGLGFTARAVLGDERVERLAVVELEESLVGWMRDGTVPHGPAFLADERLSVVVADVRTAVEEAEPASYDLVLLDVDNGPGYLVHDGNEEVYAHAFLATAARLLCDGGVLAVWSADAAPGLEQEMRAIGDTATVAVPVRLQERDEQYWLYTVRPTRPVPGA